MNAGDLAVFALRGLAGGVLVVVFALVAEVVTPKAFSGLFAAAPSIAIASLAITVIAEGAATAQQASVGMTVGGVAMAGCCLLAVRAIPRVGAVWGSAVAWTVWIVISFGLYWAVFIGAR
jgi:Protein of unknown function (DUF3147)